MIDYLRGRVVHLESDYIVIEVQGIGYRVFCANPYAFQRGSDEEKIVYIHHHVREDAVLLYGFSDREEQRLFRRLLDVSGIGPRVALGILSGGTPSALITAIHHEDLTYLTKLPGIGKKTAQRMILDLKDKLTLGGEELGSHDRVDGLIDDAEAGTSPSAQALRSAREGLAALGFTEAEIARVWPAVKSAVKPEDSEDIIMKLALQQLYKG